MLIACAQTLQRREIARDELASIKSEGLLKAHLHGGELLVLESWELRGQRLSGNGQRLDATRKAIERGHLTVELEEVALLELDEFQMADWSVGMSAVSLISLGITVACAANPKACFGSCPTFYVDEHLIAEGFSASFAAALEASDLDHLGRLRPSAGEVRIVMRNEALESHYVRDVELLAVPCAPDEMVVVQHDSAQLWRVRGAGALRGTQARLLGEADAQEYFSLADSTDLATKEFLPLHFDAQPARRYGLMIQSRQSLMSTYLFYQGIAYLGSHYPTWLASLQGERRSTGAEGMVELLGGIELQRQHAGQWQAVAAIAESGPLASDRKLIALPADWDPKRQPLRLCMTRGMWRLDAVQLVELIEPVHAQPLALRGIEGLDSARQQQLRDPDQHLLTLPGDDVTLRFAALESPAIYFLRSEGYYIEWMRDRWLEEEDLSLALAMFRQPAATLRRLAPQYKQVERQMEQIFWESRYAQD